MRIFCDHCSFYFFEDIVCPNCYSDNVECSTCRVISREKEKIKDNIKRLERLIDRQHETILEDLKLISEKNKILTAIYELCNKYQKNSRQIYVPSYGMCVDTSEPTGILDELLKILNKKNNEL